MRSRFAESSNANPSGLAELAERITEIERLVAITWSHCQTLDKPETAHVAQLQKSNVELQEQRHALQKEIARLKRRLKQSQNTWPTRGTWR